MWKKSLLLILIWMSGWQGLRAEGQLYFMDYATSFDNWQARGHLSIEKRAYPDYNNLMLRLKMAEQTSLQPKSYAPLFPIEIPILSSEYVYSFDFTLTDFQLGDSFVIAAYYPPDDMGNYYAFRCLIVASSNSVGQKFECHFAYVSDNEENIIKNYVHSPPVVMHDYGFRNGQMYTATLTRSGRTSLCLEIVQAGKADGVVHGRCYHGLSTMRPSVQHPKIIVDQSDIASPDAVMAIHRFLFADRAYFLRTAVKKMSQRDPAWKDDLLGHTSDQTIEDIGCFLTSIVMIMRAHGYHQFPDGTTIDPRSLNYWLQQQPDGYVNQNLLNMGAITRLSNQLHRHYLSRNVLLPKFEYKVDTSGSYYHVMRDRLAHQQPVILEIPGHFLVATGIDFDRTVEINDPWYEETRLDQSDRYQIIRSVRQLVPSFTDQSYIVINIIGQATIKYISQTTRDYLTLPLYEVGTGKQIGKQLLVVKPQSGYYHFDLYPEDDETQFSLFVYNQEASVAAYAPTQLPLTEPIAIKFDYVKDDPINFYRPEGWSPTAEPTQPGQCHQFW